VKSKDEEQGQENQSWQECFNDTVCNGRTMAREPEGDKSAKSDGREVSEEQQESAGCRVRQLASQ
jgi:hypothetical protein